MPTVLTSPYGNPWSGDALYNIRIGYDQIRVSFRFIPQTSGAVNQLRYFNAFSLTRPGYHAGTGGKIRIELCDNVAGVGDIPGQVLATATLPDPLNATAFPLVTFNNSVSLSAGQVYHLVFTNYDADPAANYVSVNAMSVLKARGTTTAPYQREVSDVDMTVLWYHRYNQRWERFHPDLVITPIFTLFYGNGGAKQVVVPGYGGTESWFRWPKPIGGDARVRQRFTPSARYQVKNVAVRLARRSPATTLSLVAKVFDSAKKVVAVGSVPASAVPVVDTTVISGYRAGHDWATIQFQAAAILYEGQEYTVELSAPADHVYEIYPLRDGWHQYGFASTWENGIAEYTGSAGEDTWRGWDAWDKANQPMGDLQLYFNSSQ